MERSTILQGDALSVLRGLDSESVHLCCSSPPYWGLRAYSAGVSEMGNEQRMDCGGAFTKNPCGICYICKLVEVFEEVRRVLRKDGCIWLNIGDSYSNDTKWGGQSGNKNYTSAAGGYTGQRVRRGKDCDPKRASAPGQPFQNHPSGLKPKDLCMIPARLALALQASGWWLRSDCIWSKPNPMPGSQTDRPTVAHEMVYLFSKSSHYFYDAESVKEDQADYEYQRRIREHQNGLGTIYDLAADGNTGQAPASKSGAVRNTRARGELAIKNTRGHSHGTIPFADRDPDANGAQSRHGAMLEHEAPRGSRTLRSVWTLPTEANSMAICPECHAYWDRNPPKEHCGAKVVSHFALFPQKLVARMILSGSSEKVCSECRAPWIRQVEKTGGTIGKAWHDHSSDGDGQKMSGQAQSESHGRNGNEPYRVRDLGIHPSCKHDAATEPAIVLDPFSGAGSTGLAALRLGRSYIGIELNENYARMSEARLAGIAAQGMLNVI